MEQTVDDTNCKTWVTLKF